MITPQSYRLSKNQLHTSHYPSTIIILSSNLPKKEKKKQKKKYQLSPLPHTHTHARNNFHPVRTQKSCGPEQHETISFHETYIIPTRGHELTVPPPLHDYTRKPVKRRSTNERACMYGMYTHTHTNVARVRWQREGEREMPTRHGETETCTHDGGRSGWEGRGEAGAPVSAFQRRTSAPRLEHAYTHMRAHTYNSARTRARPVSHQAGFSKLGAFERSSRLPRAPCLLALFCHPIVRTYVCTYVRTYYRHVRDEQPANPDSPFVRCIRVVARVVAKRSGTKYSP